MRRYERNFIGLLTPAVVMFSVPGVADARRSLAVEIKKIGQRLLIAHTRVHLSASCRHLELTATCSVKLRLFLSAFKSRLKTHMFSTGFC